MEYFLLSIQFSLIGQKNTIMYKHILIYESNIVYFIYDFTILNFMFTTYTFGGFILKQLRKAKFKEINFKFFNLSMRDRSSGTIYILD